MRHRRSGKKLNRNTSQRKALFRSFISSLFLKGEVKTTLAKAKATKGLVDKLITKAKKGSLHNQRLIHAFLQNKKATKKLVKEIAPRFGKRISGFTRIIRLGKRRGDGASMAKMELLGPKKPLVAKTKKEHSKK